MRNKLKKEERRISLTITLDPVIYGYIKDEINKSRYIEKLIYAYLIENEIIKK